MSTVPKTIFMFSGQGSHYNQMGRSLFDGNPIFRAHMQRLDEWARDSVGASIVDLLYSPLTRHDTPLTQTRLTHPAIFMVEYSLAQALIGAGVVPDIVLGTSLGSFVAAVLAGFVGLEDALHAVLQQALALEEHCEPGGMIAVLGDPKLFDQPLFRHHGDCAAVNYAQHFVLSGPLQGCDAIQRGLTLCDVPWQRLAVSHAFHSRWMDPARHQFESFAKSMRISAGSLPLICCDRAARLTTLHHGHFWDVTRHPIRFAKAITGLENTGTYRYVDAGPSGTLATLMKHVLPAGSSSTVHVVLSPYGREREHWAALTARVGSPSVRHL